MSAQGNISFGFAVAPVERPDTSDSALYEEVIADCRLGHALGYESAWMLEHHFTDYFPTPSPLVFMANIAAACPGLGLGTCVLVLPWYDPLRFAEEVSMLSILCSGNLHLGLGRGTAKIEYDAFDVDMSEARERFAEAWEVVQTALTGEPFVHHGQFFNVRREVKLRPRPIMERINFYGAIGSPPSATIMADFGMPPLAITNFPLHMQHDLIENWTARTLENGGDVDVDKPILIHTFLGDSDDEARALVKRYAPGFFALQAKHYEVDADHWKDIKGYEQFSKYFANLIKLSDPDKIEPWIDLQAVGTPATAAARIQAYIDLGFNKFVIHAATVGVPRAVRHDVLKRFAAEVAPNFTDALGDRSAA